MYGGSGCRGATVLLAGAMEGFPPEPSWRLVFEGSAARIAPWSFQEAEGIFRPNLRWHLDYLSIIHDNLLVLQGVPASQSLRRAQLHFHKKAWGRIHCFLEALRAKLAVSRDCMLSFTCFAYSTMILFLEEFSGFENTLHEYLGNISRYISAISTGTDIEHWANVAHDWFLKAYGRYPTAGEPNFSLGITSPNAVSKFRDRNTKLLGSRVIPGKSIKSSSPST